MSHKSMVILFIFFAVAAHAQDTLNMTDSKGRRQGFWRKADTAGQVIYEGRFRDGFPEGEFRYFYPDGKLKTVSKLSNHGRRAETVSYFRNGKKMAVGNYINEKKDSTWQFFSETTGSVVSRETYKAGVIEGETSIFYPDGVMSEMIHYKNGIRNGPWEQYYLDGKLKLRGAYLAGDKEGAFKSYYVSGQLMMTGQYALGHQDGTWIYHDENGEISKKEIYNKGKLVKTELPGN